LNLVICSFGHLVIFRASGFSLRASGVILIRR